MSSQPWRKPSSREAERNMHLKWEAVHSVPDTAPQMQGHSFRGEPWAQDRASTELARVSFFLTLHFASIFSKQLVTTKLLQCYRKRVASPVYGFQCLEINRHMGLLNWPWEWSQSWDLCSLLVYWQFMVLGWKTVEQASRWCQDDRYWSPAHSSPTA